MINVAFGLAGMIVNVRLLLPSLNRMDLNTAFTVALPALILFEYLR